MASVVAAFWLWARGGRDLGQAKVEDFGVAAFGDEDVSGLDVAVDDAFGVGGVEGVGNFDGECRGAVHLHRAAGDPVLEGLAFETFHGDEGLAVLFADVVDGADVGMIESGGGLGLAAKAGEGLRILSNDRREEILERRSDRGECPRLCRPPPCRRRRASRSRDSERCFVRRVRKIPAFCGPRVTCD